MNHAHLTLRPWRLSDAAVLPGLIGDPAVQRNLRDGLPLPYTEEDARAFLTAMLAADPEEAFPFAIAWEDVAIGSLSLFRQGNIHRCAAELASVTALYASRGRYSCIFLWSKTWLP